VGSNGWDNKYDRVVYLLKGRMRTAGSIHTISTAVLSITLLIHTLLTILIIPYTTLLTIIIIPYTTLLTIIIIPIILIILMINELSPLQTSTALFRADGLQRDGKLADAL
jgi:hypothetical protein